jgi:glyoxylate/hydroxypyruvate reductase A
MAILMRPHFDIDHKYWRPLLEEKLAHLDFRVWPDVGDANEIEYVICWRVYDGDESAYPNLKAVISLKAGVERFIGNPHFPQNAKLVRMVDPGMTASMAEYVASFVLRFHRDHDEMVELGKAHPWPVPIPKRAEQRTVGFLGFGVLAQACAEKISSMGFHVQGWRKSNSTDNDIHCFAGKDALPEFLQSTDILVCLLPLTDETENIINKDTLAMLPDGASFINAARGAHVVDEDLVAAIDSGKLKYTALDVFREEPLPLDHPFLEPRRQNRIIVTPHIAAVTMPDTGSDIICQTIDQLEKGETPIGLVDLQKGY